MQQFLFKPEYEIIGNVPPTVSIAQLENCSSVYSASPEFAIKHCGPIVETILAQVPQSYFDECKNRKLLPNLDIRVHRLYPGIYPAFPGWHCDAEFRETYFSQPDLERTPVSNTIVCTLSSHKNGVSNTQFLAEEFTAFIEDSDDQILWRQVHKQVMNKMPLSVINSKDGDLIQFSNRCLHRAMPTVNRGWRLFFRMSMWHKPYLHGDGKVSKQEQVYQVLEENGW